MPRGRPPPSKATTLRELLRVVAHPLLQLAAAAGLPARISAYADSLAVITAHRRHRCSSPVPRRGSRTPRRSGRASGDGNRTGGSEPYSRAGVARSSSSLRSARPPASGRRGESTTRRRAARRGRRECLLAARVHRPQRPRLSSRPVNASPRATVRSSRRGRPSSGQTSQERRSSSSTASSARVHAAAATTRAAPRPLVAGRGPLGRGVGEARPSTRCMRFGELELERRRAPSGGSARARARAGGRPKSSPRQPAAARRRRGARRASPGQRSVGWPSSCGSGGLLEVVADELVQLDQLAAMLLQPGREALVQLGSRRLRQRVVRGVADQQMAEAEAVVVPRTAPCRAGSAPCERAPPGAVSPGVSSASACTAPRWKISPSTAPRSSTSRSAGRAGRAAREQRLQLGRTTTLALRLASHRHHLLDEERVAAGGAGDPLAELGDRARGSAPSTSVSPSGSSRSAIGHCGCRSTSSGRARQKQEDGAPVEAARRAR